MPHSLPNLKIEPENTIHITVIFKASTIKALDDLQERFPDEGPDNLINHAIQAFWCRTCVQLPGGGLA
jgi:hypothetical protein